MLRAAGQPRTHTAAPPPSSSPAVVATGPDGSLLQQEHVGRRRRCSTFSHPCLRDRTRQASDRDPVQGDAPRERTRPGPPPGGGGARAAPMGRDETAVQLPPAAGPVQELL